MNAIEVKNLSKKFPLYHSSNKRILEFLSRGKVKAHTDFWALRDINFEVPQGSTLGIIGQNGSGKSTLLSILAGVLQPTEGTFSVNGRVSALLELGAGFHPEFSGRDNVYMYGTIMGLSKKEIDKRFEEIVDFSELHEFIDQPLRTYSSGMAVRLAFSVAVNVDADILIVDEALAVGDVLFQHRCFSKIRQLQEEGKTILYVGHDTSAIRNLCTSGFLLDAGMIIESGDPNFVADSYDALIMERDRIYKEGLLKNNIVFEKNNNKINIDFIEKNTGVRFGPRDVEVIKVEMLDRDMNCRTVFESGEEVHIRIRMKFNKTIEKNFNVGFIIRNKYGDIYGSNAFWQNRDLGVYYKDEVLVVDFIQNLNVGIGSYRLIIAPAVTNSDCDSTIFDWINDALMFEITSKEFFMGSANLFSKISIVTVE